MELILFDRRLGHDASSLQAAKNRKTVVSLCWPSIRMYRTSQMLLSKETDKRIVPKKCVSPSPGSEARILKASFRKTAH